MVFFNVFKSIKNFLSASVSKEYEKEFVIYINRSNVIKAKFTSAIFIIIEIIQLITSFVLVKSVFLKKLDLYYEFMYAVLLIVMLVYLSIFTKLKSNISEYGKAISLAGISFTIVILSWCAGISLLDQLLSGQIIVYSIAIIAIAVTPILKPATLFFVYLTIHALFLFLLSHFQSSSGILFGDYINSTAFIIISWAISCMRYKKQVDDFNNKKIIQEKNNELKRLNKKLKELSQIDGLTGIFNRFVFDKKIRTEWERCKLHLIPLTLIMIDIDFFKEFNDNYGHLAGDYCLKKVAKVFSDCVGDSKNIAARYGGEEFSIILIDMNKENVLEFAEGLRENIERLAIPHLHSSISKYITISLGVHTIVPSDTSSVEKFIQTADEALYEAKKCRNSIVVA